MLFPKKAKEPRKASALITLGQGLRLADFITAVKNKLSENLIQLDFDTKRRQRITEKGYCLFIVRSLYQIVKPPEFVDVGFINLD